MFGILIALLLVVFALNIAHNLDVVDISGLRDTVAGWSPSAADMLFIAVEDEEAQVTDDTQNGGESSTSGQEAGTEGAGEETQGQTDTTGANDMAPIAPTA